MFPLGWILPACIVLLNYNRILVLRHCTRQSDDNRQRKEEQIIITITAIMAMTFEISHTHTQFCYRVDDPSGTERNLHRSWLPFAGKGYWLRRGLVWDRMSPPEASFKRHTAQDIIITPWWVNGVRVGYGRGMNEWIFIFQLEISAAVELWRKSTPFRANTYCVVGKASGKLSNPVTGGYVFRYFPQFFVLARNASVIA